FTVGINDDVTNNSISVKELIDAAPDGTISCKFYGLGSDGTVGANKNSIKIIGDHTEKYAQGYFEYDSKKSGGLTISHLRFGNTPIRSSYLVDQANFIACHQPSYVTHYDMLSDLKDGGIFLLNCQWSIDELNEKLPASMKNALAAKKVRFYIIDAIKVVQAIGLGNRINSVMQAGFFKLANVIPYTEAESYMKAMVKKSYGKKGDAIVNMNYAAIDNAIAGLVEVKIPAEWATTTEGATLEPVTNDTYFTNVINPILAQNGNKLPVSAFTPDGTVPTGTTKYEKRGIAVTVPEWIPENCIQCNQCAFVCPHATIRPVLATPLELKGKPEAFVTKAATGVNGYEYRMQISPLDCTGCNNCVNVCPAKTKALKMIPLEEALVKETANWNFAANLPETTAPYKKDTVKGSQFSKPLFEFSGACAGCGETPYVKTITQMFGDRMIIANATGCSSIYGGSAPTCPYTTNDKGNGPAWANSLFEDNAEFGYGIHLAYKARRLAVAEKMEQLLHLEISELLKDSINAWLNGKDDAKASEIASAKLLLAIPEELKTAQGGMASLLVGILNEKDCLIKKSIWIFGGDGWAYDIGYNGVDHVLASGEDVNILVLDTEVYSNTGGQASKSTPVGAIAKFAATGKRTKKKDLGRLAMGYGYAYVAQVSMGANMNQFVKALAEAEAYKGPSLIIAYSPCINHGINMTKSQAEMKKAVDTGYWQLYRYNPALLGTETNPFTLDSKEPSEDYQSFLEGEIRYSSLKKQNPEAAEKLFAQNEKEAKERATYYKMLSDK
ncbi:MAG: pyruvate:ferredoxin (flavodoxin) oxidoreductase, partial [Clostridia bacterium]